MDGELLDSNATRLRSLSQFCEFSANQVDREIISQIIEFGNSKEVTAKALRSGNSLTLKELLDWGRPREIAELQVRSITEAKAVAELNSVRVS